MIVTEDTKKTAQDALDYLLTHPERHNQNVWFNFPGVNDVMRFSPEDANVCDTTMCVAGTVMWQKAGYIDARVVSTFAKEKLGLDADEASWMFHGTNNESAIDALVAIANGDRDKFTALYVTLD